MTTKRKIILGFTLVLAVLIGVAVMGYRGLSGATASFTRYNELSHANVYLGDMQSSVYLTAYDVERFMNTREVRFIRAAVDSAEKAGKEAEKVLPYIRRPERREALNATLRNIASYVTLLRAVEKNLMAWRVQYVDVIMPALEYLQNATETIGKNASGTENLRILSRINSVWASTTTMAERIMEFSQDATPQTEKKAEDSLNSFRQAMEALGSAVLSDAARKDYAAYTAAFERVEKNFAAQKGNALAARRDINASYDLDTKITAVITDLNKAVDAEMRTTSEDTLAENRSAQAFMLGASVGGSALGALFATFIIVGLIRILNRVSGYAEAVANGDFTFDPRITEKGEIGGMVAALRHIPETLRNVINACNDTAGNIARGRFRDRLKEENFPGGFGELAVAVNTVSNSYTKVIDELPVSIMAADLDRKIQFLNAMAQAVAGGNAMGEFCGDKLKAGECATDQCFGKRSLRDNKNASGEVAVESPNGAMHLAVSSMPLYDLAGKPAGSMEIITDITQIKNQQITTMLQSI